MSIINTSSFHSDLLPLIKDWFGSYEIPTYYDKMLSVEKADDRAYQVDAIYQTMGLLQSKDEGNPTSYDISHEAYKPTYRHLTYSLGFQITMEMMEDGDVMKNAKMFIEMLKDSALRTKETLSANVYNNAFTSSVVMTNGDGVCLVSSAHPAGLGQTQSNLITGGSVDISEAALEQITIDIKNMKDHRGNRIGVTPDKLIVSVTDQPQAHRILGSPLRVATADNDLNYLRDQSLIPGGIVANPYLTGTHAFFVTTSVKNGVKYLSRKEPMVDDAPDFDTANAKYKVIMRCSTGWSDWRGVIGSNGP